jgi:hypothetical protein
MIVVWGLWPTAVDRLLDRTGKVPPFMWCLTAARSETQARSQAEQYGAEYGIPWGDPERVACQTVRHYGPMPQEGYTAFGGGSRS